MVIELGHLTLLKEFSPWLQEVKGDYKQARCKACLKTFSVHYEGKTALQKHMNSEIHRACMKSLGNNTLITYTSSSVSEINCLFS
jgi:hypothetical protein